MGRWGAAVVALLTIVTFLPALRNEFVGGFDDAKNFLTNPHYRGLGWTQLEWMFTTTHMGQYVPLTWITLGLDYLLWGMNAAGYHLTSLLLHAVTAVLFYSVSRRLIGRATGRPEAWATAAGAAVAALLFAVHPLRVESVVWVTERRDVVSGVFYMLALLAWFRAVEREPRSRPWYWASVALFAGALLSKALTVALPVVLLVLDVYPLRRLGGAQGWWTPGARRVYAEKAPFVALAAVAAVIALVAIVRLGNMAALERPDMMQGKPRTINMSQLGDALTSAEPPVRALMVYNSKETFEGILKRFRGEVDVPLLNAQVQSLRFYHGARGQIVPFGQRRYETRFPRSQTTSEAVRDRQAQRSLQCRWSAEDRRGL